MEMPAEDGISLFAFAFENEDDDKLFSRWIGLAQYEISFDEFKRQLMPARVDEKKTLEEIDKLMANTVWEKMGVNNYGNL